MSEISPLNYRSLHTGNRVRAVFITRKCSCIKQTVTYRAESKETHAIIENSEIMMKISYRLKNMQQTGENRKMADSPHSMGV